MKKTERNVKGGHLRPVSMGCRPVLEVVFQELEQLLSLDIGEVGNRKSSTLCDYLGCSVRAFDFVEPWTLLKGGEKGLGGVGWTNLPPLLDLSNFRLENSSFTRHGCGMVRRMC
jgi:hypothetical protein